MCWVAVAPAKPRLKERKTMVFTHDTSIPCWRWWSLEVVWCCFFFFGKDGYEESCKHEDFLSFYKLLRDVSWTRQRSSSMIQRWGPKPWMMETQWIWSTCGILGDTRNGMAIGLIKVMIPTASGRRWIWMIDFLMFECVFLRKLFKHHLHGFLINFPFSGKRRWPGFYSRHARLPGEPWIG